MDGLGIRMEACSLKFISTACAGEQMSGLPETQVQRVCTDSRQVKAGDLFFALRGDGSMGTIFCEKRQRRGPLQWWSSAGACRQLERLCDDRRGRHTQGAGPVGRGLSKRFCAASSGGGWLERKDDNERTGGIGAEGTTRDTVERGQFNNDIGVPLTLLRLDRSHQAAVLESGRSTSRVNSRRQ